MKFLDISSVNDPTIWVEYDIEKYFTTRDGASMLAPGVGVWQAITSGFEPGVNRGEFKWVPRVVWE